MIQSSASLLAKDYNKNVVAMPTETCKLPSRDAIIEILSKMKSRAVPTVALVITMKRYEIRNKKSLFTKLYCRLAIW